MKLSRTRRRAMLVVLVLSFAVDASAGHTLTAAQKEVLADWFRQNPGHRRATLADCACGADVQNVRQGYGGQWKAVPDYHPYVATGDFDSDGNEDFAVVVVHQSGAWKLLIFNAPFRHGDPPAYLDSGLDFGRLALFFGPPRPKPYRLVIGPFESHGAVVVPKNGTYVLDWGEY